MIFWIFLLSYFVLISETRNIKRQQNDLDSVKFPGYKIGNSHVNLTPCIDKDCVQKNIDKSNQKQRLQHHNGKNHHGKRHHRRHKAKKLPASKGFTLQGEDPSISNQNHGWHKDASVPRGVSRLEHKIHPNIRHPAKEFMETLQTVLRKIQEKIRTVDNEYISAGTMSKKAMIEIRRELEFITEENNNVYDSLIDVSQLVRYVYRRAHEHGLTAPVSMTSISYPEIIIKDFHKDTRKWQFAENNASVTFNHVMALKRRGVQQDAAKSNVLSKVKNKSLSEKYRYFEMYDLQQKVRLVLQKCDSLTANVFIPVRRRLMKHKTRENNITERIQHAKYLNGLAYTDTKTARETFQLNQKYHKRIMKDRIARGKVPQRRKRSTEDEHLAQKVKRRVQQLEEVSNIVLSKLSPLVTKATVVIKEKQKAGSSVLSQTRNILSKLSATLAKMEIKMDEIRIFLNDQNILEARCKEISANKNIESIINCRKYDIYEGTGSGDVYEGSGDVDDEDAILKVTTLDQNKKTTKQTSIVPTTTLQSTKSRQSLPTTGKPDTTVQTKHTTEPSISTSPKAPSTTLSSSSVPTSPSSQSSTTSSSTTEVTVSTSLLSTLGPSIPFTNATTHAPSSQSQSSTAKSPTVTPTSFPASVKASSTKQMTPIQGTTITFASSSSKSSIATSLPTTEKSSTTERAISTTKMFSSQSTTMSITSPTSKSSTATHTPLETTEKLTTKPTPSTTKMTSYQSTTLNMSSSSKASTTISMPATTEKVSSTQTSPSTTKMTQSQGTTKNITPLVSTKEPTIEGSGDGMGDGETDEDKNNEDDFVFDTTILVQSTTSATNLVLTSIGSIPTTVSDVPVQSTEASTVPSSTYTVTKTSVKTTNPTSITEEPDIDEGTGDGENGFKFEDDTKVDEEKKEDKVTTEKSWWSGWLNDQNAIYDPHRDFKDKLSAKAHIVREESDQVHSNWMNVSVKAIDMRDRWQAITDHLMHLGSYVHVATGLKMAWNTRKPMIVDILKTTSQSVIDILHKSEVAENRSNEALIVANEKLDKMLKLKQQRLSKDTTGNGGAAFIADLISTVQTVNEKSKALAELQKINQSPCRDVQNTATRLRTSIAQLRTRIDKAKTITSAISSTLSLDGKGFVKAIAADNVVSISPTSSIGFCVKPNNENMQLGTFYGNSSESYSLVLEDLKLVLKIQKENKNVQEVSFGTPLRKAEWNSISLRRVGRTVELNVTQNGTEGTVEDSYIPDIAAMQHPFSEAIIGKTISSSDAPLFSGCLSNMIVNGRQVSFSKTDGTLKQCTNGCYNADQKSMVFEGDGFAKFSLYLIDVSYIDNINIVFQTLHKEGVLLFINDRLKSLQVAISLSEGAIHVEVSTRRGTTVKRSSKDTYSDGQNHRLKIIFQSDNIEVTTEDIEDKFEQELARQEITSRIDDGIYLGGLAVQSHSLSGKAKLRSFSGCISTFSISNKEIPLYMIEESKNVYYGMCKENIWRKCVNYNDKSLPLKFLKNTDSNKIYLVFASKSLGTILHLQRIKGEDFDITIIVDNTGVEILDNKENKEFHLMSDSPDRDWHILSIEDNDKEMLTVTLGESAIKVPYDEPWRFFGAPDLEYNLGIGGLIDEKTISFQGGISTLILKDRSIDLQEYMRSNNLESCERLAIAHIESDKKEKPVC